MRPDVLINIFNVFMIALVSFQVLYQKQRFTLG
ncbi:hypothetical protein XM38_026430 [Halomicronema hongdechloris C2206]|uniref:Uncharacterized protein n=1 Tax=Halomicronema hongdechloris C2206 TaxID=1641165 RepID=A0A1Z3HN15_9CYAN|nr:hypothetical protein XM38_026430 [Halomicronema hongdechloris C2206]